MMETNRRALLGAMAVLPAVAFPVVPALAIDRSAWERATADHAAAWKRLNEHPVHNILPGDPRYAEADEDEGRCIAECMTTEATVRDTPAPDYRAVIEKLELHMHNYAEDSEGLVMAAIADLQRLASQRGA